MLTDQVKDVRAKVPVGDNGDVHGGVVAAAGRRLRAARAAGGAARHHPHRPTSALDRAADHRLRDRKYTHTHTRM